MSDRYEREFAEAVRAVRDAAGLCRAVREQFRPGVLEKADRSPVTVADYGSQAVICRVLAAAFPDDPVIAEEDSEDLRRPENADLLDEVLRRFHAVCPGADSVTLLQAIDRGGAAASSARFWTLDPIDGTKGFLRGEQYAVALALIVEGRVEVAALACPNLSDGAGTDGPPGAVFGAIRGEGAWVMPLVGDGPAVAIRVSAIDDPSAARVCESVESGHSAHDAASQVMETLGIAAAPVRLDSQAKYAVVARGEAEVYLRLPTRADYREKIWDHAAGVLMVEEAGGKVTDVDGRPLDFTLGRELSANRGVIVSNGRLHDRVLLALKSVGVSR